MKLFHLSVLILFLFCSSKNFAQKPLIQTQLSPVIQTELPKTHSNWTKKNKLGLDLTQIAFINWNAGGISSISGLFKGEFSRTYIKGNNKWRNELFLKYGLNKQDEVELRKTDDVIQFNSTYGFRRDTISNWYYSAKFNFNSQFTNGYSYPDTNTPISKLFAPAYVFLGAGVENATKKRDRTFYFSPITLKTTFVLDQNLANQGAFGGREATYITDPLNHNNQILVEKGQKVKVEFGILFSAYSKDEIFKNIFFENRLSLYTDYLNNFGNININYDTHLDLVVNQYIKANIGLHYIYDDNIKSKEEVNGVQVTRGPKSQFKQVLGVGIVYSF